MSSAGKNRSFSISVTRESLAFILQYIVVLISTSEPENMSPQLHLGVKLSPMIIFRAPKQFRRGNSYMIYYRKPYQNPSPKVSFHSNSEAYHSNMGQSVLELFTIPDITMLDATKVKISAPTSTGNLIYETNYFYQPQPQMKSEPGILVRPC